MGTAASTTMQIGRRQLERVERLVEAESLRTRQETDVRMIAMGTLVCSWLKPGSVLDVGCGVGLFSALAALFDHPVTAIDPAPGAVDVTLRRAAFHEVYVDVRRMAAQQMDRLEMQFDNVLLLDVLEHIEQDEEVLARTAEVLAPEGRVILAVPAFSKLYGPHDARGAYGVRHFRRYDRRPLIELLERHFRVTYLRYWNFLGVPVRIVENMLSNTFADRVVGPDSGAGSGWVRAGVSWWLRNVENRVPLPAGLSLIGVVEKR